MQNLNSLIPILFAYIPVLLGAVAFVFKNGGIVLGASDYPPTLSITTDDRFRRGQNESCSVHPPPSAILLHRLRCDIPATAVSQLGFPRESWTRPIRNPFVRRDSPLDDFADEFRQTCDRIRGDYCDNVVVYRALYVGFLFAATNPQTDSTIAASLIRSS